MDADRERFTLLGRCLPGGLRRREVVLAPAESLPYVEADWRDALVVVEQGAIEIECARGGRRSFKAGDVLFLTGLGLRTLHNHGLEPALLSAVSRGTMSSAPDDSQS
jgi:hypothetical protein